ncbi:MAG: imidazolonepropionase [Myxococcota bacterium]
MKVFVGIRELVTMSGHGPSPEDRLGVVGDAALAVDDAGRVAWLGPAAEVAQHAPDGERVDLGGAVVLPGLVDPHTHLVFAGDRAADFEARCRGESYAQIAARGGGIRTTVRATRAASEDELEALARPRLAALLAAGATTVEVKSGYGLSVDDELKQLRVVRRLAHGPQRLVPTLLLHMVPDERAQDRAGWVRECCQTLMPAVRDEGLARAVDVFCDVGAFSRDEAQTLLAHARALGFDVKAHVEQLTATGFGVDACRLGARSLEHLEHVDAQVIAAMREAGTVAVLLPGASVFLGDRARPPVAALRAAGVPMALATDLNPGSSPTADPWLVATLACTQYGLTPAEALLGLTRHGALALGLGDGRGAIALGAPADLAVAGPAIASWRHLLYGLGHRPIARTFIAGAQVAATPTSRA